MAKKKNPTEDTESGDEQKLSLEEAMSELASIVSGMESGKETLDESLAQFERGMKLLRVCHRKLDVAAQRIEIVTQMSPDGDVKTTEFDGAATLQKSVSSTGRSRKVIADEGDDALLF